MSSNMTYILKVSGGMGMAATANNSLYKTPIEALAGLAFDIEIDNGLLFHEAACFDETTNARQWHLVID